MEYNWKFKRPNPLVTREYEAHGIPNMLGQIMINRGLGYKDYKALTEDFLQMVNDYCDNIPGIRAAANRIKRALRDEKTKIFVFSDYDTDGITSAAIFYQFCKMLSETDKRYSNNIDIYIPERNEGYGISEKWCENLVDKKQKDKDHEYLVITFDNGITRRDLCKSYLHSNNIETIITDHHEPDGEIPSGIVVDPKKDEDRFGEELCGAGISWLIVYQLYKLIVNNEDEDIEYNVIKDIEDNVVKELGKALKITLGYATVGTIGDMMPMTVFNMSLLYNGLNCLNDGDENSRSPVNALAECFNLKEITTKDIGFTLAAAINACGQMGEANTAIKMFIDKEAFDTDELAQDVCKLLNKSRDETKKAKKIIENDLAADIFKDDLFCIYIMKNIPHGIAGKLANHITDNTGKPAIVLVDTGIEELKGSGRCQNETIDMLSVLKTLETEELINYANGHQAACGVSFNKSQIEDAKYRLNELLLDKLESEEITIHPSKDLYIDATINVKDINLKNYQLINTLPYSMNFYNPNLCIKGFIVKARSSQSNVNNICYTIKDLTNNDKIDIWVWNKKAQEYFDNKPTRISLVGSLVRNFMNPKQITMDVADIKFI